MTNEIKWKEITWEFSDKQLEAFDILEDKETTEIFFGGGAGGGKSRLCVSWLIYSCLKYPGIRCVMGRARLSDLKKSTLLTFFEVCKEWGLKKDVHYIYNSHSNLIKWNNSSEIYLKDMFAYPSDPEFDSLGSTEYTFGFVDEVSEVTIKAKEVLTSRMRYKLDKFGLYPKTLFASNPAKNWAYYDFYKPFRDNSLPKHRKFIQALAKDNPWIPKHYIDNLKRLSKNSKQRLLYGNWEYDDDPTRLFEIDDLKSMFTNTPKPSEDKFLSVDVARYGADKTVIMLWQGLKIKKIWSYTKQSLEVTRRTIEKKAEEYQIKHAHIIVDEDGMGGGIVDEMKTIKGFVNNSKPLETYQRFDKATMNYRNLKSQCYFYLAEKVRLGEIGVYECDAKTKETIIEELEQIKWKDPDKDNRMMVLTKKEIKEFLGRSPDFADAIMMRMFFELRMRRKAGISMGRRRVGI